MNGKVNEMRKGLDGRPVRTRTLMEGWGQRKQCAAGVVRGDPGESGAKETKCEPGGVTCFFSRCAMLFTALRLHTLLPLPRIRFIHRPTIPSIPVCISSFLSCPAAAAKSLQSCLTLCDPIDGSPPGSPIPGILQARTLEWVAISFSNA